MKATTFTITAKIFESVTGVINNTDHLDYIQCSGGKPWHTTHPKNIAHPLHPLMAMELPNGIGSSQHENVPWHTTRTAQERLEVCSKEPKTLTGPPNSPAPRSQSYPELVWRAESSPIQHTRPKGSITNVLVPDNTRHTLRSYEHALTVNLHNIKKMVLILLLIGVHQELCSWKNLILHMQDCFTLEIKVVWCSDETSSRCGFKLKAPSTFSPTACLPCPCYVFSTLQS